LIFLDKTCGDDAALREEVESLLRAHEQAGSFAEHAAADGLAGRPLQRDDRLGSYEIIELLGAGSGCSATLPRRSATRCAPSWTNRSRKFRRDRYQSMRDLVVDLRRPSRQTVETRAPGS
jgi:hypothetical protein